MPSLENVKVGDLVTIRESQQGPRINHVTRLTATQVVVDRLKFRKKDGVLVGSDPGGWHFINATPTTPEDMVLVQEARTRRRLAGLLQKASKECKSCPIGKAQALTAALRAFLSEGT